MANPAEQCKYRVSHKDISESNGVGKRIDNITILAFVGQPKEAACASPFMVDFAFCTQERLKLNEKNCECSPEFEGTRSPEWQKYLDTVNIVP